MKTYKTANKIIRLDFVTSVEFVDGKVVRLYVAGMSEPVVTGITQELKDALAEYGFDLGELEGIRFFKIYLDYDRNFHSVISRAEEILTQMCYNNKDKILECHKTGEIFAFARAKFMYLKTTKDITREKLEQIITQNVGKNLTEIMEIDEDTYNKDLKEYGVL